MTRVMVKWSLGDTTLKRHTQVIAISACGDGDEMGMSLNRSPFLQKLHFQMNTLCFQSVDDNPLYISAERKQAFFEKLILVYLTFLLINGPVHEIQQWYVRPAKPQISLRKCAV